jgi:hypothetical protein
MDKRDKRVKFMAKLPPELHRWLKIAAAERGVDMNAVLVAALDSARMRLDGEAVLVPAEWLESVNALTAELEALDAYRDRMAALRQGRRDTWMAIKENWLVIRAKPKELQS